MSTIVRPGDPIVSCLACGLSHRLPLEAQQALASEIGFRERHAGHPVTLGIIAAPGLAAQYGFGWNSDVKLAFQAVQAMTVTNLHSLASSPTAGWGSAVVDNSTNLFLDALMRIKLDPANTAPANSKAFFIYGYSGLNDTTYATTGASTGGTPGTEGALTFPDITANPVNLPLLKVIPYVAQDVVIVSPVFSIALGFGGALPPKWGVGLVNHSGAALAASGNAVEYQGLYATVI